MRYVVIILIMFFFISGCEQPPCITGGKVSITFVGDVCFDWGVEDVLADGVDPFRHVAPIIRESTISFCNLETPITARGTRQIKLYTFRCPPEVLVHVTNAGFDVAGLGNNHAMDYSELGLIDTLSNVERFGLFTTGAGTNLSHATQPVYIETNGFRIGFLAFGYMNSAHSHLVATDFQAGVAPLDTAIITNAVALVSPEVDFLIVSLHWGKEYSDYPTETQREMGHAVIDAGADLIAGHHPHILQGIEFYQGGVIFYSLGNFMFPQTDYVWKRTTVLPAVELTMTVSNSVSTNYDYRYVVTPLYRNMETYDPEFPTSETNRLILEHLVEISSDLNGGDLIFEMRQKDGWTNFVMRMNE